MIRGENGKVERTLYYEDGTTELPLTDLSYLVAEVRQFGRVLATYTYLPTPDPVETEIEEGDETNEVRIHISSELSETFKEGAVYIRLKMRKTDATYDDGYQADIDEWTPFSVTV